MKYRDNTSASKQLIDKISKMSPMAVEVAYLYANNYMLYGLDVTDKWVTAVQNASALEKAYAKGYYDALQSQKENVKENLDENQNRI